MFCFTLEQFAETLAAVELGCDRIERNLVEEIRTLQEELRLVRAIIPTSNLLAQDIAQRITRLENMIATRTAELEKENRIIELQ